MLTKCQLPSPAVALKPAIPGWLDPESKINLEIRWGICGVKARLFPDFLCKSHVSRSKGMA